MQAPPPPAGATPHVAPASRPRAAAKRAQRAEFTKVLIDQLRAAPLNYRDCLRLFFNDAATGTRNGSVHLPCAPARLPPSRCCR